MKKIIVSIFFSMTLLGGLWANETKNVDIELNLLESGLVDYQSNLVVEKIALTRIYEKEMKLKFLSKSLGKVKESNVVVDDSNKKALNKKRIDRLESGIISETRKVKDYENSVLLECEKFGIITLAFLVFYNILIIIKKRKKNQISGAVESLEDDSATFELYRLKARSLLVLFYIFVIVSTFLIENLTYIWTSISVFSAVIILGIREQLGDLLMGLIFKSSSLTSLFLGPISEGQRIEIQSEDEPGTGSIYKITKFNLFKTIIFNEDTNEIESIKNADFVRLRIAHLPVANLHNIKLKYIIPVGKNLQKIRDMVDLLVNEELKKDEFKIKFQELKPIWPETNNQFNVFPTIRNKTKYKIRARNEIANDLIISITLYTQMSKGDSIFYFYKKIQDKLREMQVFEEFKEYNLIKQ